MKDNKQIETVLDSFNNMSRAELSPFVKSRILHSIFEQEKDIEMELPLKRVFWILSFATLFLFVNTIILHNKKYNNKTESNQTSYKDNSNEYYFNTTSLFYNDDKQ
jgi:hypothetical protein